ncbi:unnamed protein product [Rotaria socialis]|uniref:RRM domain-containing protein n=3 Tax=Rotaria socialis TaxID=392032 RepID=A0A818QAP0_9BILA|nr:unnamed protein product [Rotaria socialis]CAF3192903.1 unnamed protein product [Rotaria socialis]CAF3194250.1 unnamed protein product [Rotaria socialis]CAF3312633.1 unnamed protein product [Rotaria socialis]CAF3461462.1 unnamed protein product [Rotaria socialis]
MFRHQQSAKPCPNICSPVQKIHSTPMRLWISNIPYYWSTIELENIFSTFGQVYDVEIPLKNGQSRGYGFVTFEKQADAIRAIQAMDGQTINGRSMQVYQAHVKQKSLLKSYFVIQSLDRPLFGGCYCCKSNKINRMNYGQAHQCQ